MENVASLIGDHVDLWRTPLHRPTIMLTFAYLRRPPTTHAWRLPFRRDHVDLCIRPPTTHARRSPFHRPAIMLTRTPLHRPTIMLTFAYLRRPPTTHAWRSPFHRPAIMLTLHNFGDHRLYTYGERHFIDRRSCHPSPFICNF